MQRKRAGRAGERESGGLTEGAGPFTLERLSCSENLHVMCCDSAASPIGWEVVQLVGLQTLTLAILVRVQASQPIFREVSRSF
jgi:hypothetical protein